MKRSKKGFTLVELVIVIAVIGILAAVLIPTFAGAIGDANKTAAEIEAEKLRAEIIAKFSDFDAFCVLNKGKGKEDIDNNDGKFTKKDNIVKIGDVSIELLATDEGKENIRIGVIGTEDADIDAAKYDDKFKGKNAIVYLTSSGYIVTITSEDIDVKQGNTLPLKTA